MRRDEFLEKFDFPGFQSLMKQLALNRRQTEKTTPIILPEFKRYQQLAAAGYRYIPVYTEQVNDAETPVTAYTKLTQGTSGFLLESVERGEQVGRYSFIGWDPLFVFKASGGVLTCADQNGSCLIKGEPLAEIEKIMNSLKVASLPELGKFYGGVVGFTGYDYVREIEKLPSKAESLTGLPDLYWIIPKYIARFDHVSHKITLIVLSRVEEEDVEASYGKAERELADILTRFDREIHLDSIPNKVTQGINPSRDHILSKAEFIKRVERIKEYIRAGDAFQVVLSHRLSQDYSGDPFLFYRLLRTINPSPYLFYLNFSDLQLVGSSPEVMVRIEEGRATLKPIAGTRPRGGTAVDDERLRRELLTDEKERAEHVMLVDLGRNDLGKVCKFGSVQVTELMAVELYSHVMHIVSTIQGELLPGYSSFDLLRAVFPAGTLSGAPKIRAMEIIEELEPTRREFYGGAVGYLGFNGNMDTCITIRTVLFKDRKAHLQVGAGIVADSAPEREYEESMQKAGAMLAALSMAGGGRGVNNHR